MAPAEPTHRDEILSALVPPESHRRGRNCWNGRREWLHFLRGAERTPRGSFIINNETAEPHTVTVTVTKTSTGVTYNPPDEPQTTPIWKRTYQYEVASETQLEEQEVLTEDGTYYIEAETEPADPPGSRITNDSEWLPMGPDHIVITITYTNIEITATHDDL